MTTSRNCNKLFNYIGNKAYLIDWVNDKIKNESIDNYIEPFCGSAVIYYNLNKELKSATINDSDKNIAYFHSVLNYGWKHYNAILDEIFSKYGDIAKDKSAFDRFKSGYNTELKFKSNYHEYLLHLLNSGFMSFLQIHEGNFTGGWNMKLYRVKTEKMYNHLRSKLYNLTISNKDYKDVIKDKDNTLIFLDPPYVEGKEIDYINNFNQDELLNIISKYKKSKIIYTDIYNINQYNLLTSNGFTMYNSPKKLRSIGYKGAKLNTTKKEVIYTNF